MLHGKMMFSMLFYLHWGSLKTCTSRLFPLPTVLCLTTCVASFLWLASTLTLALLVASALASTLVEATMHWRYMERYPQQITTPWQSSGTHYHPDGGRLRTAKFACENLVEHAVYKVHKTLHKLWILCGAGLSVWHAKVSHPSHMVIIISNCCTLYMLCIWTISNKWCHVLHEHEDSMHAGAKRCKGGILQVMLAMNGAPKRCALDN